MLEGVMTRTALSDTFCFICWVII